MPREVFLHIAARMRRRREELNINLEEMALRTNQPSERIELFESAREVIPSDVLCVIGAALDTPVSYFFRNDQEPQLQRPEDGFRKTGSELNLFDSSQIQAREHSTGQPL